MPHRQIEELRNTIAIFQTLVESHSAGRQLLIDRRAAASSRAQISKLDQLIAINVRTIESVTKALESFENQLAQLEAAERESRAPDRH